MRRWGRLSAIAVALTVVGSTTLVCGGAAHALPTPVGPVSLGQATIAFAPDFSGRVLTLSGSIAVGSGEFNGTATGTVSGSTPFFTTNAIAPFTLSGPGLAGTCSGHWLISPDAAEDGVTGLLPLPNEVVEASLSCTLQLGGGPAAETGLSVVGVEIPPTSSQYTGLFGPGTSSLPAPAPVSLGTVDVSSTFDYSLSVSYSLVGDIALGGQVFHGAASGGYAWDGDPVPFPLTGTSPSGNLSATCTDGGGLLPNPFPLVGIQGSAAAIEPLSCTGTVGTGPVGTTTLYLVTLRVVRDLSGAHSISGDATGVFLGV